MQAGDFVLSLLDNATSRHSCVYLGHCSCGLVMLIPGRFRPSLGKYYLRGTPHTLLLFPPSSSLFPLDLLGCAPVTFLFFS